MLTASMGVRPLSAVGWAATAEFDRVGPSRASTCRSWMRRLVACADWALSDASS